jgi:hypothetical protein
MKTKERDVSQSPQQLKAIQHRAKCVAWFIRKVPVGDEVWNWVVQGALRFDIKGIPAEQDYTRELDAAVEAGWLEKIRPDRYRRSRPRTPFQELAPRIEDALGGLSFFD